MDLSGIFKSIVLAVFVLFAPVMRPVHAEAAPKETGSAIYYVSSSLGDDDGKGTSPDRPWRTLDRVNRAPLSPGDQILLKAGDVFAGQLRITSSGSPGRPLRIASYGIGAKPHIAGGGIPDGSHSAAILIVNQQQIEISNIEISNNVLRARPGEPKAESYGIYVVNDGGGILEHFRFTRLKIRDVYAERIAHGSEDAFNAVVISGIRFMTAGEKRNARSSFFRDIVIADNQIERTGRFGVQIGHAGAGNADGHSRDPETGFNRDIVIRNNLFNELGGSAVQLAGARFALIENNDFNRTGSSLVPDRMVGRGSGAWVINSRDIVAQHNRSRHVRGYKDSYGMHVDFGNRNILYQYNYSEDSEGGFVEILGNNRNIIWRYNISVNDGLREKEGNTIWFSKWSKGMTLSDEIHIYNNSIFVRSGLYPDLNLQAGSATIRNNIFHVAREAMMGEKYHPGPDGSKIDIAGNLFFGRVNKTFMAADASRLVANPQFAEPGATRAEGYRLRASSPAAGAGVAVKHPEFPAAGQGIFADISETPIFDFFGTPLPVDGNPGVGAAVTFAD